MRFISSATPCAAASWEGIVWRSCMPPIFPPNARAPKWRSPSMSLESRLEYRFRDPALLELALTHPSLGHEEGGRHFHNERLEFLGDAVLEMAITHHLYHLDPNASEGRLTKMRAH